MAAVWFSFEAAHKLWNYTKLNTSTYAKVVSWRIIELSTDKVSIEANYQFRSHQKEYFNRMIFSAPYYPNRLSAEKAIQDFSSKDWTVWFCDAFPEYSSLQKLFPFQSCIKAFLAVVITLYFFFLKGLVLGLRF